MTAPSARGLFHKAIVQSGGGRWIAPSLEASSGKFLSARQIGAKAANAFRLPAGKAIEGLRGKSWQDILERLRQAGIADHTPFLDGQLLTGQMEQVFERGEQAPVPLIVGANSYEGVLLRKALHVSEKEVERAAGQQYDELSAMYQPQLIMTDGFLADHIWGDAHFVEPARMIARAAAHKGVPVYHYNFDFQPPLLRLLGGSPHGLEVAYALGTLRKIVPFPLNVLMHQHNYTVSRLMMTYWTNFAKTGDPNGGGELEWPRFQQGGEETLVFGNAGLASSATTSRSGSTCSRLSSGDGRLRKRKVEHAACVGFGDQRQGRAIRFAQQRAVFKDLARRLQPALGIEFREGLHLPLPGQRLPKNPRGKRFPAEVQVADHPAERRVRFIQEPVHLWREPARHIPIIGLGQ